MGIVRNGSQHKTVSPRRQVIRDACPTGALQANGVFHVEMELTRAYPLSKRPARSARDIASKRSYRSLSGNGMSAPALIGFVGLWPILAVGIYVLTHPDVPSISLIAPLTLLTVAS